MSLCTLLHHTLCTLLHHTLCTLLHHTPCPVLHAHAFPSFSMHVVLVHQASVVRYFKGHSDAVMSVQWSPHFDNYFVSASNDNTVVLWDINGTAISSVPDHSSARAGA